MDIATLAAAKRYTNETVIGMGALKGAPCTVKSVTPVTGGNEVILSWTATDGSVTESSFVVKDGVSVVGVSIDTTTNSLIVELSDGSTKNAGVLPKGEKGDKGFSPTITENPDNTNEIYKLDVTNENGTFTTPNLKGTGGGLDPDKYYDKAQINALIEPLDEAKHTHDNKDTVLDKLTTNDTGDTLLFNGNAIKGSVEIDDTTTTATDKVWSAKKTNDTFEEVKQSITDTNAKFADYDTSVEVDGKITTALTDYEKSADVDNKLAGYDKSTVVDKKITDALADYDTSEVVDNKLKDYAKTTEVDTKLADYYKKTETYSNTEIDTKITDLTTELKTWVNGDESLGIKTVLYANNILMFYKKPNATITDVADFTIILPAEQFLDQANTTFVNSFIWSEETYPNSINPNLDGQPVLALAVKGDAETSYSFVSMNELVKIYKASTVVSTVTLTINDATNTISGEVNISADEGNLLKVGTDGGLYAKATDITGKADKLTDTDIKENQILLDDGTGNIKASGKDISEYIPAWSGTKAQWEALDKTPLADGTIINITDDFAESPEYISVWSGTKAQWDALDKTTLADEAVINITDDFVENPVQVKVMPSTATEGDVVQYIGLSDTSYTHGYFYEYAVNETGILSWKHLPVDAVYKPSNEEVLNKFSENDEGKVLYDNKPLSSDNLWHGTQAEYDALGEYDENKTYIITDSNEEADLSEVVIDDTSTTAINKTWSAKKINESIPNSDDFVQNLKMWSTGDIETLALESVSGLVTISSAVTGMPIDSAAWIGTVNATSTHRQISVQPFGNSSLLYSKIYNASTQTWSAWTKIDAGSIEGKKVNDLLQNLGTLTSGSLLDYILTLPASGFIYCNGNVTDTPVVGTYFIVDVRKMGTTYGVTAIKFNSGEIYTNRYNSTSKTWYGWKQMATINDKSTTSETETYSVKKINDTLSMFPFKWKLIGTSTPETGATSNNTFKQTMSSGNPFCVYHSSGIFCFGNGTPTNRGKLYGMTSGVVASVTYTTAGLLTVQVDSGTAYIYEMEGIV